MDTTTNRFAVIGTGRSIHLAYYVGDKLTGTYCNRAAWERGRVFIIDADAATCARCLKVAASETSVPNTEADRCQVEQRSANGLPINYCLAHGQDANQCHTTTEEPAMTTATRRPTAYPTNATFLAHTAHADRERRDDACRICSDIGPSRMAWDEFTATYPEWAAPYGGTGRITPKARNYSSQHAVPDAEANGILDAALYRVAEAALNLPTNGLPGELLDYLAVRAESFAPETIGLMWDTIGAGTEGSSIGEVEMARVESHAYGVRSEAARAVMVALGIPTENMAPIDYPTVTRYWLACRNAYGWRG